MFNIHDVESFAVRHIGTNETQIQEMLAVVGVESLDQLINETVPPSIRLKQPLRLPKAKSETRFLADIQTLARKNKVFKNYIGLGYHDCAVPTVIQRNILENPGWYTAYTPYQAEIAQGRLEMLANFQTLIIDLTGMEIANASLLDEGTAAAEAMSLFLATRKGKQRKIATKFFISELCLPQTIEVLKTRAEPLGVELVIGKHENFDFSDETYFGVLLQYPAQDGQVLDYSDFIAKAQKQNIRTAVAADLMALVLLKEPSKMGADAVVGTSQRFGVPLGFGGPHAGYFATHEKYKRQIPGRIIGLSKDKNGKPAYRMALQTREQHIRREKATSNICTAQVLLAVMSAAYAIYHGANGLRTIAGRIHGLTQVLADGLQKVDFEVVHQTYFDTLKIKVSESQKETIRELAEKHEVNFRYFEENFIGISIHENTRNYHISEILQIFAKANKKTLDFDLDELTQNLRLRSSENLARTSDFLIHPVFTAYHSEHEMLRYLKSLENKDLSLVHSMIPLGSCTMKLNATSEMIPITLPELTQIHPFAPKSQTKGYDLLCDNLEKWLCEITGFDAVSLQPNSGAQGEYAGLLTIRAAHLANGDTHRNIALIPQSAHGTNPASAVMAGMKVVIVKCDENGNIDLTDLNSKVEKYQNELSSLMVTYPSTHGVFEEEIKEICEIIHQAGGYVYMDGANMNAQVGLTSPAEIGADVCHLNLHKTFCIPHGGGGPGMGPIGVNAKLAPFLSGHIFRKTGGQRPITAVSSAPFGSAGILPISYAYIAMAGAEGLTQATKGAILNANYLKDRLIPHYPILYLGKNGRCAHEMIVDFRQFKKSANIEVEDVAKRLMDYGFHAPTVSFPVAGTLMIEPTESESKAELDRFCEAMIAIRHEIQEIEDGKANPENNLLKNAPHTASEVTAEVWDRPYSREKAVFPLSWVKANKFWVSVNRIDSAYGDRNLFCSCAPISDYE